MPTKCPKKTMPRWSNDEKATPAAPSRPASSEIVMPWGKHKGKSLGDLPRGYLSWVLGCDALTPELERAVKGELRRRGEKHLEAAEVLNAVEEEVTARVVEDPAVTHAVAALVGDHLLDAFEVVRARFGVGEETELVVRGQRAEFDGFLKSRGITHA